MDYIQSSLLIVDDNEMNRDMLSRRLAREGYTVAVAADGEEALRIMQVERFDLILLDLLMPGMDGFAVLEEMRQDDKLRDTPVIVLTALKEKESVTRCLELGADDYLLKPFEMVTVKTRIWRCLESRRIRRRLDSAPQRRSGRDPRTHHDLTGATVLVVEDESLSRELLVRRVQQAAGLAARSAADGTEALRVLRTMPCDLVLLDLVLPDMDGYDVLDEIKSDDELRHVPVIVVSMEHDPAVIRRCMDAGAADYVTKPFNALELQSRLPSCIRLKKLQDAEREMQDLMRR